MVPSWPVFRRSGPRDHVVGELQPLPHGKLKRLVPASGLLLFEAFDPLGLGSSPNFRVSPSCFLETAPESDDTKLVMLASRPLGSDGPVKPGTRKVPFSVIGETSFHQELG